MSNDVIRWGLGLMVLVHGIGHMLFMPLLAETLRLGTDGRSWLLTGVLGESPTRLLATLVAGVIAIAFIAAGLGIIVSAGWWRPVVIAAAVASMTLVVAMWDGIPTSSALFAFLFDGLVLVALLVADWPSSETMGA
jgi:hypothetical protein